MICFINGENVEARTVDNLGFVSAVGTYAKVVEYEENEYCVIKEAGRWRTRSCREKFLPADDYRGV